jgi:hypothetical protein
MLRRVALVRTDVSEEISASIIRVTGIGELGTTLAVTSNQRTVRRNILITVIPGCPQSVQILNGWHLKFLHDRFLPHTSHFIIHYPARYCWRYNVICSS